MGLVGAPCEISTPISAFSRSITPRRSRTCEAVTCPAFTERMICLVLPPLVVVEVEPAVNALVRAFLLFMGRAPPAPAPTTETDTDRLAAAPRAPVRSTARRLLRRFRARRRRTHRRRRFLMRLMARCVMSMPIQRRFKLLRRGDSGAAAAEGIENDVALVAAGFDDAFQQRFWFLGRDSRGALRPSESMASRCRPKYLAQRTPLHLVEVSLVVAACPDRCLDKPRPCRSNCFHFSLRVAPVSGRLPCHSYMWVALRGHPGPVTIACCYRRPPCSSVRR